MDATLSHNHSLNIWMNVALPIGQPAWGILHGKHVHAHLKWKQIQQKTVTYCCILAVTGFQIEIFWKRHSHCCNVNWRCTCPVEMETSQLHLHKHITSGKRWLLGQGFQPSENEARQTWKAATVPKILLGIICRQPSVYLWYQCICWYVVVAF